MKRLILPVLVLLSLAPAVCAQEHYSEGPVWRTTLIRVKPAHLDDYLAVLQNTTKPAYEEAKHEGLIVDYKFFLKETKASPEDWDVCIAIEYKNHAAMDGMAAKTEAIRDKVLGGKDVAHEKAIKREDIREVISSDLLQEILVK
jgi:hypothetical protein